MKSRGDSRSLLGRDVRSTESALVECGTSILCLFAWFAAFVLFYSLARVRNKDFLFYKKGKAADSRNSGSPASSYVIDGCGASVGTNLRTGALLESVYALCEDARRPVGSRCAVLPPPFISVSCNTILCALWCGQGWEAQAGVIEPSESYRGLVSCP